MTTSLKATNPRILYRLLGRLLPSLLPGLLPGIVLCLGLGSSLAQTTPPLSFGNITSFAGVLGNKTDSSSRPATLAGLTDIGTPSAIVTDYSGNVYFADQANNVIWEVYQGDSTNPGLIGTVSQGPFVTGDAYPVVNAGAQTCVAGSTCGDGNSALTASLNSPSGLALTAADLYIADTGSQAIRMVDLYYGTITTFAGDLNHQMTAYSGENVQAAGSSLNGPTSVVVGNGNVYVVETGNNIVRMIDSGSNMTTLAGQVPTNGIPAVCTAATAPCGDAGPATSATFVHPTGITMSGLTSNLYVTDAGAGVVRVIDNSGNINTAAGTLLMGSPVPDTCAPSSPTPVNCGDGGLATSALLNSPAYTYADGKGNLFIADTNDNAVRRVDTSGIIQTIVGQLGAGGYGGDPGPAEDALLKTPTAIAFCVSLSNPLCPNGVFYVADTGNNVIRKVISAGLLKRQTLAFGQPQAVKYGASPIDLSGYASSTDTNTSAPTGLSASFSVTSGPGTISGTILTITGAGPITVQANQGGNDVYGPATPSSVVIDVTPATLTVSADPASLAFGSPVPATFKYTISGYVNSDSNSVVTGSPTFVVTDSNDTVYQPGAMPPDGPYTINIAKGSLAANNYQFVLAPGNLLVTQNLPQTLTFGSYTPPTAYGDANSNFNFSVTSSVKLPVVVTTMGPVKVQQLNETTWQATVVGAGQVILTATQAGTYVYSTAQAMSAFTVNKAVLTIPLANATRMYKTQNPAFSYNTPVGFVSLDNSSVLMGTPTYSTTATQTSDAGPYMITASQGTLSATNYSFTFLPGTLTITPATQQITDFSVPATLTATSPITSLSAIASSGLTPIIYTSTGAVQIQAGNAYIVTGLGPATITASQAGNIDYAPVSSTISFNVTQVTEYVTAYTVSIPFGTPIPQLNYCWASTDQYTGAITGCQTNVLPTPGLYSGVPTVTTTALQGSPVGTYPINVGPGTLTSSVYTFVSAPSTLTITPASSYTVSVNPSSVTVPNGQSRQVTVTVTPVNNFIGTVALACSGLPAGVTCIASPSTLTIIDNYLGISAVPVSGTLTISANQVVAGSTAGGTSRLLPAAILGLPWTLAGILIFYRRRQFQKHSILSGILILLGLSVSITCVSACGWGSSHADVVKAGTTQIMITASGMASAGTPLSESAGLSVTVQ